MQKIKKKNLFYLIVTLVITVALGLVSLVGVGPTGTGAAKNIILGLDLRGGVSITYEAVGETPSAEEMSDAIKKLQLRAEIYSTEADVYKEGDRRIVVDIPGQNDVEKVKEELGKPGALTLVVNRDTDSEEVVLDGSRIKKATAYVNNESATVGYSISLELDDEGRELFAKATEKYLGKEISIVYDGEVKSSPVVRTIITNGQCSIDGMESYQEASELASMLRIGSLSIELDVVNSNVIGPKLGEQAIETSLLAGGIGLVLIIIFMIIVYRIPGLAAGISLIIYVILELLTLNGFNMTLTLPGIAGIVLAIGMAVDANVIIYARIKEEISEGTEVRLAIKTGFKKATSAIVDGNITTFIAAVVLMILGSGTVKGFAQTLAVGIVLSMFTAMIVSRVIVNIFYNLGFKDAKFYGIQKPRKTINFLSKRVLCMILSAVVIVAGIAVMAVNEINGVADKDTALNYSVEFQGGKAMTVEFDKDYSINDFNKQIKPAIIEIIGDDDVTGSAVDGTSGFKITMKLLDDATNIKLKEMLTKDFGAQSFEENNVSAKVGNEMRKDAIIAVIVATICMLVYIFVRFRDIRFASSAVIALIHDVLIVLAFYAISWTSVGTTFIACMLTILGYSINATIVIFDRIRENLAASEKGADLKEIVNKSITETLTRSIYTTLTTLIMVLMLVILGVAAMRDFTIPLLVGIVAGGYSSVFFTGALWYGMAKKKYSEK